MHSCDRLAGGCLLLKPQFSRGQRGTRALKSQLFQQILTERLPCICQILFLHSSPCPCKTDTLGADRDELYAGVGRSVINVGSERISLSKWLLRPLGEDCPS